MNVAVVEDDEKEVALLKRYFSAYSGETEDGEVFNITHFSNAIEFLENYKSKYDIVLMDIEMPFMDGMTAAKKLREFDKSVVLIFVTNMSQFAVEGYEVDALSFIVKPVSYANFSIKLRRAIERIHRMEEKKIQIYSPEGTKVVPVSTIKYVEVRNHTIIWHTTDGEMQLSGTLKKVEENLPSEEFVRINASYIVNLRFIEKVKSNSVFVDGDELSLSRREKKNFFSAFTDYIEG